MADRESDKVLLLQVLCSALSAPYLTITVCELCKLNIIGVCV
jgi:hypothetical protein